MTVTVAWSTPAVSVVGITEILESDGLGPLELRVTVLELAVRYPGAAKKSV